MSLTIVGLGPGAADDLSRRAWRALETAAHVYLRTERHPCVPHLPTGPQYHPCDDLYEQHEQFADVYAAIVARVLEAAQHGPVVYAVPGDPLIGEATVLALLEQAAALGIDVQIVAGISFLEPTMALLNRTVPSAARIDAMNGLQIADALLIAAQHHPALNPATPAVIAQVYSRQVANDLKLTLMNQYPDDFEVILLHAGGTDAAHAEPMPLYAIDRSPQIGVLTSLYLPPLGEHTSFESFQETIAHLRAPEGCPWDQKQTHASLRPFMLEESYEAVEAIDNDDSAALLEELGDVLLQVVLHTQIAIEDGEFRMADVLQYVNRKLIRRHPHVWGQVQVDGAAQVLVNWDAIKFQEQRDKPRTSRLDGVPSGLPALMQAFQYREKAAKIGFDWARAEDVLDKVREEIDEVQRAASDAERYDELGDLLFALVNWAKWIGVEDPEGALRQANAKFARRFQYVEAAMKAQDPDGNTRFDAAALDAFWRAAKAQGL
jgi:tetrapyrrole methylase family protein / MazG family protein